MSDTMSRITLARRPKGAPAPEDFKLETGPLPAPSDGEVLIEVTHLSLDPYMRGRMDDVKSYAPSVDLGGTMTGQGVGRVLASKADGFAEGDTVTGMTGWASHACLPGKDLRKLDSSLPPSTALGVLGMPGLTGWVGLNEFGKPKAGETLVVGAATGPVGSMVGQLAKQMGLRTIAIAGGAEKCRLATETFGFDAAIDHRAHDDAASLRKAISEVAPDGVDIYWENVGGQVLEAVMPLMNVHGRIPVCGMIAWYGGSNIAPENQLPGMWRSILVKRLKVSGFIIFDHWNQYPAFLKDVGPKVAAGEIAYLEDVAEGLENAPDAFIAMLKGGNTGKQIVKL
ncbi:NADP-dependent oxidoreductase [Marivita sp. XM-24bin2]|jgi:NADPH-dependent curcumin reductase CurA|uniref:NADP-dependent oxidoreductase n=1 Tax=unclassified Marivita TaxID=2632480 RepID=UPI000D78EB46|nr:NADP-dependent oxidoreductase [Marivita sp. XM-24bin2]MCR9108278.1 NADP-dependent oxidoreductase [Paracoccaceae bacterium]PWL37183.1 MAG: NADP-dependent oxidoreductase [Marivita sp. XM-24bin2]